MRKIRAFVIALLCLTIGGVYATWTFADDKSVDRKGETVTITLAGKSETSEVLGSLSIEFSDDFAITINQKRQAAPGVTADHTAVIEIVGDITLKFKANASAEKDVRAAGVEAQYYLAASNISYNDDSDESDAPVAIYNINTEARYKISPVGTAGAEREWLFNTETNEFYYVIENSELVDLIKINTFEIDNSAEYAAFNEVLRTGTVTLYVNDTATPEA